MGSTESGPRAVLKRLSFVISHYFVSPLPVIEKNVFFPLGEVNALTPPYQHLRSLLAISSRGWHHSQVPLEGVKRSAWFAHTGLCFSSYRWETGQGALRERGGSSHSS